MDCFSSCAGFSFCFNTNAMCKAEAETLEDRGEISNKASSLVKITKCTHPYIHSIHTWLLGCVCAHQHLHRYVALPQYTTQSVTEIDGRTTGEATALIKSLMYSIPQCTGAFHYTCNKGITEPAEYPRTFNNWIAGSGCLATMAGAGDDLVIL